MISITEQIKTYRADCDEIAERAYNHLSNLVDYYIESSRIAHALAENSVFKENINIEVPKVPYKITKEVMEISIFNTDNDKIREVEDIYITSYMAYLIAQKASVRIKHEELDFTFDVKSPRKIFRKFGIERDTIKMTVRLKKLHRGA